jgi:FAD/FMN-containing dehydrogenase
VTNQTQGSDAPLPLNDATITNFARSLRGSLLRPGATDYDKARRVWNAMIDRRPALIARCLGTADVIAAVNFARESGLLLAVRGGGHNVAGNAVCDGGLMIDLSAMKSVRIDPEARTARAEPGVTWSDFDHEAQAFGLATTGGVVATTGIAGLTLGGGLGWLQGTYGLTCDNLLSADLVTADGLRLTASANENEDLFWGLRGGGGNFGVVTSFEYRLHPVSSLYAGLLAYPLERAREVFDVWEKLTRDIPDALTTQFGLVTAPDGTKVCAIFVCFNGAKSVAEQTLQPLAHLGAPLVDGLAVMSYGDVQNIFTPGFPEGHQSYWKSHFVEHLQGGAIDILMTAYKAAPAPSGGIVIEQLSGHARRVDPGATAFSHRHARFNLLIVGFWDDPAQNDARKRWVRDAWQATKKFSSGSVYVNYLDDVADEGVERIRAAYGRETYERLVRLKRKYDPQNLFRLNQNVLP